ncbi:MAG: TIGR00375 family protein [Firmicutes bacterium]|nr:TIGR00375 family protein [Bacillota bacterium]
MKEFYVDLHVHLGVNWKGGPVKITASPQMSLKRILVEARERKGLDIVGIVDTLGPLVQEELQQLCRENILRELPGGGLRHKNGITLILAGELETKEGAHFIVYLPNLNSLQGFAELVSPFITNINLSTQRAAITLQELVSMAATSGGLVIPAHAFTPHKGVYGCAVRRLKELFPGNIPPTLPGLELGLSADTFLADRIAESQQLTFLSNSDAHSLGKLAREYNVIRCREASYEELMAALAGIGGRKLASNYGLEPRLGKYYRTFCSACAYIAQEPGPIFTCPRCDSDQVVLGVRDRIDFIADWDQAHSPPGRPPYNYQIPLEFIPGIGPRTLARVLSTFGTEMNVLHNTSPQELAKALGERLARRIVQAREGRLPIIPGGGGKYGRICL